MEKPVLTQINLEHAKEYVMLERILDKAHSFYKNPENVKAFEAWKKNKEDLHNDAPDYANA